MHLMQVNFPTGRITINQPQCGRHSGELADALKISLAIGVDDCSAFAPCLSSMRGPRFLMPRTVALEITVALQVQLLIERAYAHILRGDDPQG